MNKLKYTYEIILYGLFFNICLFASFPNYFIRQKTICFFIGILLACITLYYQYNVKNKLINRINYLINKYLLHKGNKYD